MALIIEVALELQQIRYIVSGSLRKPHPRSRCTAFCHFKITLPKNNDKVANPESPSPGNYGWNMINNEWVAVMATEKPASEAVLHLVKCGCTKTQCTTMQCNCKKAGLYCTDLCMCSEQDDNECDNADQGMIVEAEDDEEEVEDVNDEDEEY